MPPSSRAPLTYRPDLDGLRSLAIVPVVLYHYGLGGFGGGFIGVDVFFVISGFLITALLLRDIEAGGFSIVRFYERRARRILPALFFVLAVTTFLSLWVLLPIDLANYGKSLTATMGFVSNLVFWREFGYFDRAAELKPLLHTWSLSVEEQFYILFPPFLWLIARAGRTHVRTILFACLLASLALSVIAATRWPAAGFYLPVTRAWELLIGALLAAGAVPLTASSRTRDALSIGGIGLILGSAVLFTQAMPFPGWRAALPCSGAALVIYASLSGGAIGNRLLAWQPLVWIGLVSYSLYLWHWPLLVLAKYAANRELTGLELTGVLLTTGALSFVSWRYVESPFRGSRTGYSRRRVFELAGLGTGLSAAIGLAFVLSGGLPSRLPPEVLRYAQVTSERLETRPECFNLRAEDVREGRLCRIGGDRAAAPSFIVWGDSHASRLAVPLGELARARERTGLVAAAGSCPPLVDIRWPVQGCDPFNAAVVALVEREQIRTVILAGMWASYAEGTRFKHALGAGTANVLSDRFSVKRTVAENSTVFARALLRTVERLNAAGAHVVIIGPVPEIASAVPETLAKAEWFGGAKEIGPSEAEFAYRQRHVLEAFDAVARNRAVTILYPGSLSCAGRCAVERRGEVLYIDDNHLSRAGLALVKPLFTGIFDEAGGEPRIVVRRAGG